ncbi:retrovirus-related pol polyprotein from transposon TNT 1-94 [Tanacetum coccineum]|uniref:Retrovirus-related pol polyprotein from transposon TNT 1-94 n=1 Tax=Tanacetum coccineum TaxID=301880 RepID=A0ABQ5GAI2_9ASTR
MMNELVNDGIKLSKLEINTGFINWLQKKWLSFYQSLRNTNHVKESELASLFGKLKYEENLIDSIYETEKKKYLVSATPLSTAFISTSIVQDFQDSPNNEEDTRSSQEYMDDLEEEYQARALLAKSKRFFKKDKEEVSSDDIEMVKVKVLMALADDNVAVRKEGVRNGEWIKISMRKCDIRKPIWYLDSRCSRHMTGVKSYLHKYVEQLGPKLVFGDNSTYNTLYRQRLIIKFSRMNLQSVATPLPQLKKLDAPAKGNKSSSASKVHSSHAGKLKSVKIEDDPSLAIVMKELNSEALQAKKAEALKSTRAELSDANRSKTPTKRSTIVKRHLKTPYEIFCGRIPNIDFLHVFGCPFYIHNHKDYLGKFDEKDDNGYFLGYFLVSKVFRVFNTRRQQIEETYHIIFDESTDAIKFTKPSVDNINIVESERYPHDEYLYPYKPSQRYLKDHILKGDIELHFIPTQYQLADIFTKPLDEPTFKRLIVELEEPVEFKAPRISSKAEKRVSQGKCLELKLDSEENNLQSTHLSLKLRQTKSASGCDASADSTAEVDPGISAPNDYIPQQ